MVASAEQNGKARVLTRESETSSELSVSAKNIFPCTNVNASSLLALDKLLIGWDIAADRSRLSRSHLLRYL